MYKAYGLIIDSEVPLDNPCGASSPADVRVVYGRVEKPWSEEEDRDPRYVRMYDDDAYIVWDADDQRGVIRVREGREIVVDTDGERSAPFVKQVIQGIGLGLILQQRHEYVLHASAVAIHGEAVAFIGQKGAGKSTTASALFKRGHSLITDDLLAIQLPENDPRAYAISGIPSFKLWPDSVQASLQEQPGSLPRIFEREEKRLRRIEEGFVLSPLPLKCVYVLEYSSEPEGNPVIERLGGQQGCMQLICHSYALRFLGNNGRNVAHLKQTRALLLRAPVFRLRRPRSLDHLVQLVECIESHDL